MVVLVQAFETSQTTHLQVDLQESGTYYFFAKAIFYKHLERVFWGY